MPLSTLMFLNCSSANFTDPGAGDCGAAAGDCARAATIAVATENIDTRAMARVLFPAFGIRRRTPLNFWRQECSRTMERICYPQVISRNANRRRLNCDCDREWKQQKIFTTESPEFTEKQKAD